MRPSRHDPRRQSGRFHNRSNRRTNTELIQSLQYRLGVTERHIIHESYVAEGAVAHAGSCRPFDWRELYRWQIPGTMKEKSNSSILT
jgi:hypothetical protein